MGTLTYDGPSVGAASDPAPSFGTPGATDWGRWASGALSDAGGLANQGLSLYDQFRGHRGQGSAEHADPSATAAGARQTPDHPTSKIPGWAIFAGLGVGALVVVLLIQR